MKPVFLLVFLFFNFYLHAQQEKPNVLLLMADDLNTSLSGYGHPQCKTPELDKLAAEGVQFNSMHCQYPICGASRASMMTGLYPYSNGMLGNLGNLRRNLPDVVTMSQLFMQNGYRVARVSKIYHMAIPHEINKGTAEHDDPASWEVAVNVQAPEHKAPGEKTNWSPKDKGSQSFIGVISTAGDLEHADGKAASEAIRLLKEYKDEPFFLAVGFVRPHVPLVAPEKYFDLYDRESMEAPVVPEGDLEDVPEVIRNYKRNSTKYGVTSERHKGLLEAYYASVFLYGCTGGKSIERTGGFGAERQYDRGLFQ
jgi:iduronate 2-sulfatase